MDDHMRGHFDGYDDRGYALSGKIMLSAIVILFFVVILMVCLHLYARWYLLRARRRHNHRRGNRRSRNHLVFHVDNSASAAANRGLDAAVLNALPVFVFKSLAAENDDSKSPIECAVCLSEFEESETGRRLPKCSHCFHTECIDMWFHSHSTCPLCRSPVEISSDPEVIVQIGEPEAGPEELSSTGLCSECQCEESSSSSSSSSSAIEDRRKKKPVSVSIEVPRRNESFGRGGDGDSPASFRSPMSRMLSFKSRMLSSFRSPREAPATATATASCSSVNELDLEKGKDGAQ